MNRFAFLGTQTDEQGVEWCYILDTKNGTTVKSRVQQIGAVAPVEEHKTVTTTAEKGPVFPEDTVTAPGAVKEDPLFGKPNAEGELETKEQREYRLAHPKVPSAFSAKMGMDPGKTDGVTDVTHTH